jgi:membrane fusion protein, peptide pheromone/bacteriocin exporter
MSGRPPGPRRPALLPGAAIADTLEVYLARTAVRRRPVYLAAVAAVAAALLALPLVRVDVSVQAGGLVRPVMEKSEVQAPVSGRIAAFPVRRNQRVQRGDALARLETGELDQEAGALRARVAQLDAFTADLERLTSGSGGPATPRYQREAAQLRGELAEVELSRERAARELERATALLERGLGPAADVEARRHEVAEAAAAARLAAERWRSRWQAELAQLRLERADAAAALARVGEARSLHAVAAPVAGTVEELASVAPGSFVQAGTRLAVISPASRMVAELYVPPRDVGLLRVGMPVRLHVDAFRFSDWGFLPGEIVEIADDFTLVGGAPVFVVRCALARDTLTLPNGAVGRVKKGMTLRAHFVVARRRLWDLLRDDVSDWVDPRLGAEAPKEAP